MKAREKLQKALNHQEATLPVDFGATAVTGLHATCVEALRERYGLEKRPVKIHEPYQMLGLVEDDLVEALGIDTVGVFPRNTMFGFPCERWKEWRTPWGQEVLVPVDFNVTRADGYIYIYPEGDTSAPPSAQMPECGFFFDTIVRQPKVDDANLDPEDNLEEFGPVSDEDLAHFKLETQRAVTTGRGVVATFGGLAFGDIALVPAPFLKHPKGIRDISQWYMSTMMRQDYIHAIFRKQLDYALSNLEKINNVVGDNVDVVFICGTDFGTQAGTFCAPEAYEELWDPYYRAVNDWIHQHTSWKTFKHSCGAVFDFMELFIRSGFDIVNPVQCSATGMDPVELKKQFGDRLVFWGGGVDTQKTLPFGTPEEVRRQSLERCETFAAGGGFVFDAIHNVQARTPVENIVAMIEAVREFNGQPVSEKTE